MYTRGTCAPRIRAYKQRIWPLSLEEENWLTGSLESSARARAHTPPRTFAKFRARRIRRTCCLVADRSQNVCSRSYTLSPRFVLTDKERKNNENAINVQRHMRVILNDVWQYGKQSEKRLTLMTQDAAPTRSSASGFVFFCYRYISHFPSARSRTGFLHFCFPR